MKARIESPEDLGRLIRRLREARSWPQRKLAAELGVSQRYLHELEAGKAKRIDAHYFRVLELLGITLTAEAEEPEHGG